MPEQSPPVSPDELAVMAPVVEAPGREALRMFMRNKAAVFGALLLISVLVLTLIVPIFYDRDPGDLVARPHLSPGSDGAPFLGTDNLGRNIWTIVIYGGRPTLEIAAGAATMIILAGITLGALAGYYGGWVDSLLMRITEFFQVLPGLLFAIVLVALFEPSFWSITIAIGFISWPQLMRLTRSEFLRLKNLEFVKAARAIGSTDFRIITRVILPNAMPTLIVSATLIMGGAILTESGLAFLGLGDPNNVSWGLAIGRGREFFFRNWWAVTFPGMGIFFTVLGLSLVGDGLQDAYNPKLRGR
jgi:peptide/nickel transport system permease protein